MDDLRRWIATALSVSMALAMSVVALGVGLGLVSGQGLAIDDHPPLLEAILRWTPGSVVLLGLLLLALTPLAQLGAAAAAFARTREVRYLAITIAVLATLLGALVVAALAGGGATG